VAEESTSCRAHDLYIDVSLHVTFHDIHEDSLCRASAAHCEFQCLHILVARKILTSNHRWSNDKASFLRWRRDVVRAAFADSISTPNCPPIQGSTVTPVACPYSFVAYVTAGRSTCGRAPQVTAMSQSSPRAVEIRLWTRSHFSPLLRPV
jgi:hypothetical protein